MNASLLIGTNIHTCAVVSLSVTGSLRESRRDEKMSTQKERFGRSRKMLGHHAQLIEFLLTRQFVRSTPKH